MKKRKKKAPRPEHRKTGKKKAPAKRKDTKRRNYQLTQKKAPQPKKQAKNKKKKQQPEKFNTKATAKPQKAKRYRQPQEENNFIQKWYKNSKGKRVYYRLEPAPKGYKYLTYIENDQPKQYLVREDLPKDWNSNNIIIYKGVVLWEAQKIIESLIDSGEMRFINFSGQLQAIGEDSGIEAEIKDYMKAVSYYLPTDEKKIYPLVDFYINTEKDILFI